MAKRSDLLLDPIDQGAAYARTLRLRINGDVVQERAALIGYQDRIASNAALVLFDDHPILFDMMFEIGEHRRGRSA